MNSPAYSLLDLQKHIAQDVWPNGALLYCTTCKRNQKINTSECANYLIQGWPKCCGKTMEEANNGNKNSRRLVENG